MAINNKRPPRKETVGAQYVCFSTPGEEGEWTGEYEVDVERTAVEKRRSNRKLGELGCIRKWRGL